MGVNLNNLADVTPQRIDTESDTITTVAVAGQTVRLETSPNGAEVASGVVPAGKQWTIQWIINISETDAVV